jgi:AcrR family transcriptional regulator
MTNAEIIDAAFRVWGRNFYQKTSLSQLAGELGVSKPALYRHFSSKQALTEAMLERYFDDFTQSVRADYQRAMQAGGPEEGVFAIIRGITGFYGRNVYAFVFALINFHNQSIDSRILTDRLKSRGVDMGSLYEIIKKEYAVDSVIMQLIFITMTFFMAHFHKAGKSFINPPSEDGIQRVTAVICDTVRNGLGFTAEGTDIDFGELEKRAEETLRCAEPEPLFRAAAEAIAEVGPWKVSMDMVAQRMGISKSSLYGHFKNRRDMLRQLFLGEFKRITGSVRQGSGLSAVPVEQLYLGIYSVAVYLRSRPEFLACLGWLRTRRVNLRKSEKQAEFSNLFENIEIGPVRNSGEGEQQPLVHWILFLLINILLQPGQTENANNKDIRVLFRFITLGLKGFKQL